LSSVSIRSDDIAADMLSRDDVSDMRPGHGRKRAFSDSALRRHRALNTWRVNTL